MNPRVPYSPPVSLKDGTERFVPDDDMRCVSSAIGKLGVFPQRSVTLPISPVAQTAFGKSSSPGLSKTMAPEDHS